jgi:hypothetical protein
VTVGLDGTTISGSNADLVDPIRYAVRMFGIQLQGTVSVVDADLISIVGWKIEKLLDIGEKRILETCVDRYIYVDSQVDRDLQKYDQLRKGWETRIAALESRLSRPYGPGTGGAVGGSLVAGRPLRNTEPLKGPGGWPFK